MTVHYLDAEGIEAAHWWYENQQHGLLKRFLENWHAA